MKRSALLITILLLTFTLSGCLSGRYIMEPKEGRETLLLGVIKMKVYGYDEHRGVNNEQIVGATEDFAEGVVVRFKNIDNKKVYVFSAKLIDEEFGLIINHRLPPGRYLFLESGARKRVYAGDYYYNFLYRALSDLRFEIVEGKINNFGEIIVHFKESRARRTWDGQENIRTEKSHYEVGKGYHKVQSWFYETYPESLWNERIWRNIMFNEKEKTLQMLL